MSVLVIIGVGLFGGLGALTRFVQDTLIYALTKTRFSWGTVSINVVGSFLIGLIAGSAAFAAADAPWRVILAVGFCGGYTTFSTAMVETVAFARENRWAAALFNLFGTFVGALSAVSAGLWLAGALAG